MAHAPLLTILGLGSDDFGNVPLLFLGMFAACVAVTIPAMLGLAKLLGWNKLPKDTAATRGELEALAVSISQCATKAEVAEVRDELSRQRDDLAKQYARLEDYTRARAHETLNAVNTLQVQLERMRVEAAKEHASLSQRIEEKISRQATVLERLEVHMEGIVGRRLSINVPVLPAAPKDPN